MHQRSGAGRVEVHQRSGEDGARGKAGILGVARSQHGVISRQQLLDLGLSRKAIAHMVSSDRLHSLWPRVYAVGRPELTSHGRWIAAVLSCGPVALLSHESAAALWEIHLSRRSWVEVSVPAHLIRRHRRGIIAHRRVPEAMQEACIFRGIPVTSPSLTLVDLAARVSRDQLEAAINAADKRELADPERLRRELPKLAALPGAGALREALDRRTFTFTDSSLERRFLPLARRAGLPKPRTRCRVNGFAVDFYWPDLGLVVETDGLRYHRTPAQQARDRIRDQAHAAAGLTALRFTHAQVRFESDRVVSTLAAVARRLRPLNRSADVFDPL